MPTPAQFSRVLYIASVLALGMTSSAAIAQNGPPPLQTEQQAALTYVSNIAYVGRSEGWTPLPFERLQGLIFFQGAINGEPATILLDNGLSYDIGVRLGHAGLPGPGWPPRSGRKGTDRENAGR